MLSLWMNYRFRSWIFYNTRLSVTFFYEIGLQAKCISPMKKLKLFWTYIFLHLMEDQWISVIELSYIWFSRHKHEINLKYIINCTGTIDYWKLSLQKTINKYTINTIIIIIIAQIYSFSYVCISIRWQFLKKCMHRNILMCQKKCLMLKSSKWNP